MRLEGNEVRQEAAGVLVSFLCSNHYSAKSKELLNEILTSFFKSSSFQHRISFIYFVTQATQKLSRDYFKKSKLFCVLDYASDKVKTVRLYLARLLPKLHCMINFDDDDDDTTEEDLEKFDKTLSKLSNKRDKEVSAVIIFQNSTLFDFDQ